MKKEHSSLWFTNRTLFVALLLVAGMGVANAAFSPAPTSPPNGNTAEPLNVGATAQTKLGKITVGDATTQGTTILEANGRLKIVDGNQAAGKVLTSDAAGVATWQAATGGGASGTDGPSFSAFRSTVSLSLPAGETSVAFDTVTLPTAQNNNDPCIASGCANGPWGYRTSDSSFKPSVPGRYLLSATARIWVAANLETELRLYKNGSLVKQSVLRDVGSQIYQSLTVTAVVDAAAGDTFSVRVYNPSSAGQVFLYGDVNGRTTFFTGSRIGAPITVEPVQTVIAPVPPQAIMFFASADPTTSTGCPAGWDLATNMNGMYVVGTTDKTKIGLSPAGVTPLASQENRNVPGPHSHAYTIYDHQHYASVSGALPLHRHYMSPNYGGSQFFTYGGNASAAGSTSIGLTPSGSYGEMYSGYTLEYYSGGNPSVSSAGWTGGMNTGVGTFNSGAASVSSTVTNAPYTQLLACKKI